MRTPTPWLAIERSRPRKRRPPITRKQLDAPPTRQVDRTFKRAPRAKTKVPTDQPLVFDGEPDVKAKLPRRAKTLKANLRRKPKKKTG